MGIEDAKQLTIEFPSDGYGGIIMPTDQLRSLWEICQLYEEGELRVPYFQRGLVWSEQKKKNWATRIIEIQHCVGAILTYQIMRGDQFSVPYLCDGRQRIESTIALLKDPAKYAPHTSEKDVIRAVKRFGMVVQHRVYESHEEGYLDFQHINQGTTMSSFEYFSGYITQSSYGERLINQLRDIVNRGVFRVCRQRKIDLMGASTDRRGWENRVNIAYFYQLATKTDSRSFWQTTSSSITKQTNPIEKMTASLLADMGERDCEEVMSKLSRIIDQLSALIEQELIKNGRFEQRLTVNLFRHFVHFWIFCINTGVSAHARDEFICSFLRHCPTGGTNITGIKDGEAFSMNVQISTMSKLSQMCKLFDIDLYPERTKQQPLAAGYDNSHVMPFSTHGNGETFPEPSSKNRSRGAKPVNQQSLFDYGENE